MGSAPYFSGECASPHESTTGRLHSADDRLGHLGVQERPYVSTSVVSTTLATGLYVRRLDLPLGGGESCSRGHSLGVCHARSVGVASSSNSRQHALHGSWPLRPEANARGRLPPLFPCLTCLAPSVDVR
jgi:hypothetical protein